jgi:hypothetical protein
VLHRAETLGKLSGAGQDSKSMHSPYAYASKRDLLEWVARLLEMELTSLDDVRTPTHW